MSPDTERIAELAALIGQRVGSALRDVIPAEAQAHLVNAQRELLTAAFLIYEHQAGARRPPPSRAPAARAPARRRPSSGGAQGSRRPRVERIEIE
ncbi:MAG TPA: hypothetical protein VKF59_02000 [Candidatus Dormibacteraeota bacterium]|nr:hypothetical protein [Candidatus Dormibacteraeota bacterium]